MGFFNWVSSSVKSAVLRGFQEAVDELENSNGNVQPTVLVLDYRPDGEPPPVRSGNGRMKTISK